MHKWNLHQVTKGDLTVTRDITRGPLVSVVNPQADFKTSIDKETDGLTEEQRFEAELFHSARS